MTQKATDDKIMDMQTSFTDIKLTKSSDFITL